MTGAVALLTVAAFALAGGAHHLAQAVTLGAAAHPMTHRTFHLIHLLGLLRREDKLRMPGRCACYRRAAANGCAGGGDILELAQQTG